MCRKEASIDTITQTELRQRKGERTGSGTHVRAEMRGLSDKLRGCSRDKQFYDINTNDPAVGS